MIILNAPTFGLYAFGSAVGSAVSALTFGMPIIYAILTKRLSIQIIFVAIGLSYFLIAGIQFYNGIESEFLARFYKFMLLVIFGVEIVKNTSKIELYYFLLIGASSIIINSIFFTDSYGRYSGLYLDPNSAGFICIVGYGLTYGLDKSKLRLIGQFLFTFAGFITFSRTFILIWLIVNLIALKLNPKNIKIFFVGAAVIALLISFSAVLKLNTVRFNQLKALATNERVSTQELNNDSRTETWAPFYKYIYDKPIFGNGYGSFTAGGYRNKGPHNSFLLVIGEAGIFALLLFLGLQLYTLYYGFIYFTQKPYILMMSIGQFLFLLTNHNYFSTYYIILISMWLVHQIKIISESRLEPS
ncbi:MAG: O-antigen ligase family protein [Arenibacter sp.]